MRAPKCRIDRRTSDHDGSWWTTKLAILIPSDCPESESPFPVFSGDNL